MTATAFGGFPPSMVWDDVIGGPLPERSFPECGRGTSSASSLGNSAHVSSEQVGTSPRVSPRIALPDDLLQKKSADFLRNHNQHRHLLLPSPIPPFERPPLPDGRPAASPSPGAAPSLSSYSAAGISSGISFSSSGSSSSPSSSFQPMTLSPPSPCASESSTPRPPPFELSRSLPTSFGEHFHAMSPGASGSGRGTARRDFRPSVSAHGSSFSSAAAAAVASTGQAAAQAPSGAAKGTGTGGRGATGNAPKEPTVFSWYNPL